MFRSNQTRLFVSYECLWSQMWFWMTHFLSLQKLTYSNQINFVMQIFQFCEALWVIYTQRFACHILNSCIYIKFKVEMYLLSTPTREQKKTKMRISQKILLLLKKFNTFLCMTLVYLTFLLRLVLLLSFFQPLIYIQCKSINRFIPMTVIEWKLILVYFLHAKNHRNYFH